MEKILRFKRGPSYWISDKQLMMLFASDVDWLPRLGSPNPGANEFLGWYYLGCGWRRVTVPIWEGLACSSHSLFSFFLCFCPIWIHIFSCLHLLKVCCCHFLNLSQLYQFSKGIQYLLSKGATLLIYYSCKISLIIQPMKYSDADTINITLGS